MKPLKKDVLSDLVYERITQMMFDGVIPPGSKIQRKELADLLEVSPTPVTEAINRLTGEGIIEQRGRDGFFVREFGYADLENLFAVRAGIEGIAVRLCVENLDDERIEEICRSFDGFAEPFDDAATRRYLKADQSFHRKMVRSCGNPYIIDYNRSYEFLLRCYQPGLIRPPSATLGEHKGIITAMRKRDGAVAQSRMAEHHLTSKRFIREHYL